MRISKPNNYLRKRNYVTLTLIILLTSATFLLIYSLSTRMAREKRENTETLLSQRIEAAYNAQLFSPTPFEGLHTVYLVGGDDLLSSVLEFQKYKPVPISFSQISQVESGAYVVIDGDCLTGNEEAFQRLCARKTLKFILYHVTPQHLATQEMRDLLGIASCSGYTRCEGIRVLDGFWSDVPLIEKRYSCTALDLKLQPGRQVYITDYPLDVPEEADGDDETSLEVLEQQTKFLPMLHRQICGRSQIFLVNGELMDIMPQGVLCGIFMQRPTYLYPTINASYCAITCFPLLTNENQEVMHSLYNRNVKQFTEEILLPDMMTMCENMKQKPSTFARTHIEQRDPSPEILTYFEEEVQKRGGSLGIMQTDEDIPMWEEWVQDNLDARKIDSTVYLDGSRDLEAKTPLLAVLRPHMDTIHPVDILSHNKVALSTVYDLPGTAPEMTIQYWACVHGYGLSALGLDMKNVYYPKEREWTETAKYMVKHIENTILQIGILEPVTLHGAALRVQQYSLMRPHIQYEPDRLVVDIDGFTGDAHFVLKTDQEIKAVTNGTFKKVGTGFSLVTFNSDHGEILLKPSKLEYGPGGVSG